MKIINAKVHGGFGLAKQMGFPTINVTFKTELLPMGIYKAHSDLGQVIVIVTDPGVAECHVPGQNLHGKSFTDLSLSNIQAVPNQGNGLINLLWSGCYFKQLKSYSWLLVIILLVFLFVIFIVYTTK